MKTVGGFCLMCLVLLGLTGCVSRYQPLQEVKPLSARCSDYVTFANSLVRQRDNGFSKHATLSIAGYLVGTEENKAILNERYKPVIDLIYADLLLGADLVKVFARVQCEHRLSERWPLLRDQHYRQVADVIRFCRQDNFLDSQMGDCLLDAAQADDAVAPPP